MLLSVVEWSWIVSDKGRNKDDYCVIRVIIVRRVSLTIPYFMCSYDTINPHNPHTYRVIPMIKDDSYSDLGQLNIRIVSCQVILVKF